MSAARLVVISGPSGVGKTTVCAELARRPGFSRVVTATTRDPRPGERPGVDYLFLAPRDFEEGIAKGEFLEWALVHGNRYGTPRRSVEDVLRSGRHAILNIDVQGAASIRGSGLPCLLVFLLPPSGAELERRLRRRATDGEDAVRARLAAARVEIARAGEFDLQVVNDDLEATVATIARSL